MTISILDACCGSRMFWFDRNNPTAVFMDNRRESCELKDSSRPKSKRMLVVEPNIIADFTELPFRDGYFSLVIFDPPHLKRAGKNGWQTKKYGKLPSEWRGNIRKGFLECFRVLKSEGILIFKWSEIQITLSSILALTEEIPLIGNRNGKNSKLHWIVFMKN